MQIVVNGREKSPRWLWIMLCEISIERCTPDEHYPHPKSYTISKVCIFTICIPARWVILDVRGMTRHRKSRQRILVHFGFMRAHNALKILGDPLKYPTIPYNGIIFSRFFQCPCMDCTDIPGDHFGLPWMSNKCNQGAVSGSTVGYPWVSGREIQSGTDFPGPKLWTLSVNGRRPFTWVSRTKCQQYTVSFR